MADRHQFRAKWHDYSCGIYFVTICSHEKRHLFGRIVGMRFIASESGKIVEENIQSIPSHYVDVELLNHVVMPNHIHMVISVGTRFIASAATDQSHPAATDQSVNTGCLKSPEHGDECIDKHHNSRLATIIGSFKAGVTRTLRTRRIASLPCWQSRYHEHIIRNKRTFDNIMNYVDTNVENWTKDCFSN